MARTLVPVDEALTLLTDMPSYITSTMAGFTPQQMHIPPEPGEWSAVELLAHLRSCADVWGDCIRVILAQDKPTIKAVNPTTWINQTDYPQLEFHDSFLAYKAQRADLLPTLESLTPEQWERTATVTGAGKALERTVLFYAQWMARHERSHKKQFKQIVSALRQL